MWPDLRKIAGYFSGRALVLLNFPNNPSGYRPTAKGSVQIHPNVLLEAARRGLKLVVLVDDAYFGLVFEQGVMRPLFALLLRTASQPAGGQA